MMLARAVGIRAVWTAFSKLQHVGQGSMGMGKHVAEGRIHEAGAA